MLAVVISVRGYGATAARLTPDQKVGSSNLSGLNFSFAAAQRLQRNGLIQASHACDPGSTPGMRILSLCRFVGLFVAAEKKSGHPESNQGPSDCCSILQSDALPTELYSRRV